MSYTKNALQPLVKSVLITLGLTTTASAADAWIHTKILGFGASGIRTMTLIISNNETEDIMKIFKSLEDSWSCWWNSQKFYRLFNGASSLD